MATLRHFLNRHLEWMVLTTGLLLLGFMNPYIDNGNSWCLFEWASLNFCPGEGLGHSIAYTFRGDFSGAVQSHIMGPAAVIILSSRIGILIRQNIITKKPDNT